MTVRAAAWAAVLGALTFANCRAISLCADGATCEARGGNAGSAAGSPSGGTQSAEAGGMGGDPDGSGTPEAGQHGGAAPPTAGDGGAPPTGAETGGTGASSEGKGGAAGGLMCQPPFEDCNRSPLNGCEVDLSRDPSHCGACNSRCDGICTRLGCQGVEPLLDRAEFLLLSFAVTDEAVYVVARNLGDGPMFGRVWRLDKPGLSARVVVDELPAFGELFVAGRRIYLYGGTDDAGSRNNLWSGSDEVDFTDEGFPVDSVASSAGVVYASQQGNLFAQKEGESTWTRQPWSFSDAPEVRLIDVSGRLCVLRRTDNRHELLLVQDPESTDGALRTLASGSGEVIRAWSTGDALYWLTKDSGLMQLSSFDIGRDSGVKSVARGTDLTDFAVDSAHVYVTRSLALDYDIEVISTLGIGPRQHLGARDEMVKPQSDGADLWFFLYGELHRIELPSESL